MGCCDLFLGIDTKDMELPRYNIAYCPCEPGYNFIGAQNKFEKMRDLELSPIWIYFGNKDGKKRDKTIAVVNCQFFTDQIL